MRVLGAIVCLSIGIILGEIAHDVLYAVAIRWSEMFNSIFFATSGVIVYRFIWEKE